ncbi:MAG: FAD-dependent monooxygenase [Pyrinomonadaceae bacterium]
MAARPILQVNLGENTLTAFFPLKGEVAGGSSARSRHNKDEAAVPYEEIEEQIEHDMGVKLDIKKTNWFSIYNVHSRAVNAFSKVVVLSPAMPLIFTRLPVRMNTGIQDSYNLAWKLAFVLNGCADESTCDLQRGAARERKEFA